jgi:hypothetical protein
MDGLGFLHGVKAICAEEPDLPISRSTPDYPVRHFLLLKIFICYSFCRAIYVKPYFPDYKVFLSRAAKYYYYPNKKKYIDMISEVYEGDQASQECEAEISQSGGVVQMVRTSACHAEGREFESRHSRHFFLKKVIPKIS